MRTDCKCIRHCQRYRNWLYDDLASVQEVADHLGVSTHRVKRWLYRQRATGCPGPVKKLTYVSLYSLAEWKGWFAIWKMTRGSETWARGPETWAQGRPRKKAGTDSNENG